MLTRRFVTARTRRARDLVDATNELAAENVNIESFIIGPDHVRLLTDHPDKALEVLRGMGLDARLDEVLQFDIPNARGSIGEIMGDLADEGVRVLDGVGIATDLSNGPVFLHVDDIAKAERVLERRTGVRLHRIER